jgi:hypothetical protein
VWTDLNMIEAALAAEVGAPTMGPSVKITGDQLERVAVIYVRARRAVAAFAPGLLRTTTVGDRPLTAG